MGMCFLSKVILQNITSIRTVKIKTIPYYLQSEIHGRDRLLITAALTGPLHIPIC